MDPRYGLSKLDKDDISTFQMTLRSIIPGEVNVENPQIVDEDIADLCFGRATPHLKYIAGVHTGCRLGTDFVNIQITAEVMADLFDRSPGYHQKTASTVV